ncbi:MAG TPA: HD domain-containing protein [Armatimonadota bacterium]|nr:HD domain-containing protein [Armatimonadota bacterium]
MSEVTLRDVRRDPRVKTYIEKANEQMAAIGYTEHGFRHAGIVAGMARGIPRELGLSSRESELAAIAGYLHDIGNVINRANHCETGAMLAHNVLTSMGMNPEEVAIVMGAIGNHEEESGFPINSISAAVIIGDKSDVHYSRVQNPNPMMFDIHDRVNHAVQKSYLRVDPESKVISLELTVNVESASVMDYFEIFLLRMVMCRRAADCLGCKFKLVINDIDL